MHAPAVLGTYRPPLPTYIELGVIDLSESMETYKVMLDGAEAGELRLYKEGLMTVMEAHCTYTSSEPFKLIVSSGGRNIPLGTMLPEADGFVFKKRYSRQALESLGIGTVDACLIGGAAALQETVAMAPHQELPKAAETQPAQLEDCPAPEPAALCPAAEAPVRPEPENRPPALRKPEWRLEPQPELLVRDPEIRRVLSQVDNAISLADGDTTWLGVPLEVGKPFPLMSIFCLGRWEKINGKNFMVFQIKDEKMEQ